MPILETQDLTYVYGAGTPFEKTAVDHISLQIEDCLLYTSPSPRD